VSVPFSRTLRALEADSARRLTLWLFIAVVLLAAWLLWFLFAEIGVYVLTAHAHLEVEGTPHAVAAQVSGRVLSSHLELGSRVKAGEILVKLDDESQRLALAEAQGRLDGFGPQIEALERQIATAREGLEAYAGSTTVALEEARAHVKQAEADARFAELRAQARQALRGQRMVAEEDLTQAVAQAERDRATVNADKLATTRLEKESAVTVIDRRAHIAKLERELAELQADAHSSELKVQRLRHELERRRIRAPIDGRLGHVQPLRAGAFVTEAQVVGAIVPNVPPRAVALFPVTSVGRIVSGQPARLRLDGFPWTEYGMLYATVVAVGNEPVNGHVRVELHVRGDSAPRIPLAHGVSGTAEVEVERATPAQLVVRTVGRWLNEGDTSRLAAHERRISPR
jgi:multidrug resistance efflux pump